MSNATANLSRLLQQAQLVTGAQMGNVQLLDGDVLRIHVHHGFRKPFLDFFNEVRHDVGSCGSALHSHGNVVVQDVERSAIFRDRDSLEAMLRADVRACQSTPIFAETGSILGVLNTHHARPRRFSPDELLQIRLLAEQASPLLEDPFLRSIAAQEHQAWNRLALDGEWDLSRKSELSELLSGLTNEGPAIIDLSQVTYVDSTVLNALAVLRLKFKDLRMTLIVPNKNVLRIFKLANFDKLFHIVEHE